jgi:hypothetical protein
MDFVESLDTACDYFLKEAKKPWSKKPPGWKKPKSIKKYYRTMTGKSKHPFSKCVEKMKDHMDNPEAFCASVKDIGKGTTKWRSTEQLKKKKKKSKKKK